MPPIMEPARLRRLVMSEKALTGRRLLGQADLAERAVEPQQVEVSVQVVRRGDAVEDEVEAAGVLRHRVGVLREDDFVGAEAFRVGFLAGRGGEEHGVRAEGVRELQPHVAESAESDDADLLARGRPSSA